MGPHIQDPKVLGTCLLCPQITSLQQEGEELSGQARCPFDATQSNVAIFAGVHLGMWLEGIPLPTWSFPHVLEWRAVGAWGRA